MLLHASAVAIGKGAILITGDAQAGKSSACFSLLAHGAKLIADDQTRLHVLGEQLIATAPSELSGLIEMVGVGVLRAPEVVDEARVAFEVHLSDSFVERLPEPQSVTYQGIAIPKFTLRARDGSNAAKILFLTQVFQQTGALETVSVAKQSTKD